MTMARVTGTSRTGLLVKVVLPSAVPTMFAGLRLTFTYSLLGVIASEMIAATSGIGQDIVLFSPGYLINTVFAIIIELVMAAVPLNACFAWSKGDFSAGRAEVDRPVASQNETSEDTASAG